MKIAILTGQITKNISEYILMKSNTWLLLKNM